MSILEMRQSDRPALKLNIRGNVTKFAMVIEMAGIFLLFQILTDGVFLSSLNLSNLLLQGCTFSILGIGMVWVMVSGGIDLSAGAVLGFLANFSAVIQTRYAFGAAPAILLTLILGVLIGCWNGYWIAYRKIPAFIATLAGQLIFKGLTLLIGGGKAQGPAGASFSQLGRGFLPGGLSILFVCLSLLLFIAYTWRKRRSQKAYGLPSLDIRLEILKITAAVLLSVLLLVTLLSYRGIPYAVVLLLLMAVLFTFLSQNTAFGRSIYAVGSSRDTAKLSGIHIPRTEMRVYAFMGLITAIASVVFLGRVGQATAMVGQNFEFSAITGCIVGGTSTLGGSGTVAGAIIGTMMMASLENGMSLMNLDSTFQYIVKGAVLLIAVSIDISSKEKAE